MKVNLRYLQHTLEQLMLFVSGLVALAFLLFGRALHACRHCDSLCFQVLCRATAGFPNHRIAGSFSEFSIP